MTDTQTWKDVFSMEDVRSVADFGSLVSTAFQSQYAHGRRFRRVGSVFQHQIDATEELASLQGMVADMNTAQGVFLDWWGQRVGVDRLLEVKGEYYRFDDDYYRFLLFYRAQCNISDATVKTINSMLSQLTDTKVFIIDYLNMTINSIVVIGAISDLQARILQTYGLLNRPAGVLTNFLIIYPDEQIFGFEGSDLLPFDQGVFNPGRTIEL